MTILMLSSLSSALIGSDGVIEINQASAQAGNVTAGDTPGFPITLSATGSYLLTSNLTLPDTTTDGIQIEASHVSLDLNGFSIIGPVSCDFMVDTVICSHPRSFAQAGVRVGGNDVTISNGAITGSTENAVVNAADLSGLRIEHIRISSNSGNGLGISGTGIVVENCYLELNGANGARLDLVTGSCELSGNTLIHNNSAGAFYRGDNNAEAICSFRNNLATDNVGDGLRQEGGTASFIGNQSIGNGGYGIGGAGSMAYGQNVFRGNDSGTIEPESPVEIGLNYCDGNTTCP
jgi:hypothetical protein